MAIDSFSFLLAPTNSAALFLSVPAFFRCRCWLFVVPPEAEEAVLLGSRRCCTETEAIVGAVCLLCWSLEVNVGGGVGSVVRDFMLNLKVEKIDFLLYFGHFSWLDYILFSFTLPIFPKVYYNLLISWIRFQISSKVRRIIWSWSRFNSGG